MDLSLSDSIPIGTWRARKKSRLERMADRATELADLRMPELRRVSGYHLKELKGLTRGQIIAEILEDEFLLDEV